MILGSDSVVQMRVARVFLAGFLLFGVLCFGVLAYNLTDGLPQRQPIDIHSIYEKYHYYFTAASQNKIALTFDDGPTPVETENIARVLNKHHAPAAFFFIGENILAYPSVAKSIADQGFLIGNHSMTHQWSVHESKERMARELNATSYLIERVTGTTPTYYRPPFLLGVGTDPTINPYIPVRRDMQWATELGYTPIGIDVDSLDWAAANAKSIERTIVFQHNHGHIVLFHDEKITADALDNILTFLEQQGYQFVSIDELLTPPSTVVLTRDLHKGDTDQSTAGAVVALQWFLYSHGYLDAYALNGIYDQQTTEAVQRFQGTEKIIDPLNVDPTVFGSVGAETRVAIARMSEQVAAAPLPEQTAQARALNIFGTVAIYAASWVHSALLIITGIALVLLVVRLGGIAILALFGLSKHRKTRHQLLAPYVPVTVIIPAYNEEQNIAATIETVARSHYEHLEIIVVNDGSKDKTQEIAETTALKFPHRSIKIISVPNGGKAKALMIGVEAATSEVVITMDGDSIFTPGTVAALARRFGDPTIAAVAGKVYTASMDSIIDRMQALEYFIGQNIEKRLLDLVNGISVVPGPVGAWRKADLVAAGGFSTDTLVEDQDMTMELLVRGRRIVYEPRAIAYAETPRSIRGFLKQRYRWIYGTIQCFWKHKWGALRQTPNLLRGDVRAIGIAVTYFNIFFYGIVLPLTYPIIDIVLVYGLLTGSASLLFGTVAAFTLFDMAYAMIGVYGEKAGLSALLMVPFTRIIYRQLLYITAIRSMVRAIEGRRMGWGTVKRTGQAQKLFKEISAAGTH